MLLLEEFMFRFDSLEVIFFQSIFRSLRTPTNPKTIIFEDLQLKSIIIQKKLKRKVSNRLIKAVFFYLLKPIHHTLALGLERGFETG